MYKVEEYSLLFYCVNCISCITGLKIGYRDFADCSRDASRNWRKLTIYMLVKELFYFSNLSICGVQV